MKLEAWAKRFFETRPYKKTVSLTDLTLLLKVNGMENVLVKSEGVA